MSGEEQLSQTWGQEDSDNMACGETLSEMGSEPHGVQGKSMWAKGTANRASCMLRQEPEEKEQGGRMGGTGHRVSRGQAPRGLAHGVNLREAANSHQGPEGSQRWYSVDVEGIQKMQSGKLEAVSRETWAVRLGTGLLFHRLHMTRDTRKGT